MLTETELQELLRNRKDRARELNTDIEDLFYGHQLDELSDEEIEALLSQDPYI